MANADGTPIWFELTVDSQDKAQQFYESVAGWTVAASPMPEHGGYRIASARDGTGVGGLMTPPPGMDGVPGWAIYFAVGDVDATAERIRELGGSVHFGPMDIPHVGRFATVADPQGVIFQIMKGSSPEDSQAFKQIEGDRALGHGVWIELASPDPDAAIAFYGTLFGWEKLGAMPMGDHGDYSFVGKGEFRPGAVMSSVATHALARWNWYIYVPDIDAAVEAAKTQGGALVVGPDQIPGGDYSAKLTDNHGHDIGIVGPRK